MSDIVFILGAGASHEGGAPVMHDFLDTAQDLLTRKQTGDVGADFERVFKGIHALQRVHSKAQLDLVNVEAVFAAFEMAKLLEVMPDSDLNQTQDLVY